MCWYTKECVAASAAAPLQLALGGGGRRLAMRDRRSPYDILTCVAQRSDIPPSATSYVTRSFRAVCHMGSCCDSCLGTLMAVVCTHCYVTLQHCGIARRCVLPYTCQYVEVTVGWPDGTLVRGGVRGYRSRSAA